MGPPEKLIPSQKSTLFNMRLPSTLQSHTNFKLSNERANTRSEEGLSLKGPWVAWRCLLHASLDALGCRSVQVFFVKSYCTHAVRSCVLTVSESFVVPSGNVGVVGW